MEYEKASLLVFFMICVTAFFPSVHAEPTVSIIMEKTTYQYCEKLFYIIQVSEVTGELAIIHIVDEKGTGSSAIPFEIKNFQNPVPSLIAFEERVFPLGKYSINVEYSGQQATAEFTLVDSDKKCLPQEMGVITNEWLYTPGFPDGLLIDAFQKFVDKELLNIPFNIDESNISDIKIPTWVKNVGYWWTQGAISDEEYVNAVDYLIQKNIIKNPIEDKSGI